MRTQGLEPGTDPVPDESPQQHATEVVLFSLTIDSQVRLCNHVVLRVWRQYWELEGVSVVLGLVQCCGYVKLTVLLIFWQIPHDEFLLLCMKDYLKCYLALQVEVCARKNPASDFCELVFQQRICKLCYTSSQNFLICYFYIIQ